MGAVAYSLISVKLTSVCPQTLLVVRQGKLELTLKTFATPQNNNNESFTDLHSDTYQQFFQLSWLA